MNRVLAIVIATAVVLASGGAGVAAWLLTRNTGPANPEISAFSHGQLVRVGPYMYCNVLDLNDCQNSGEQGELAVNHRDPIQLSVPAAISEAPWRLILAYEEPDKDSVLAFTPGSRLAVTIPTVDPLRGRLTGLAVQLPTLVDVDGELRELPHAEWSVRAVWD
jgi:Protein of unknown function (DUF2771)